MVNYISFKLILLLICFCLGGSTYFPEKKLSANYLSGIINLKLKHGVWRFLREEPIYQDLFLDLNCQQAQCESKIYGFAPKYNRDVEHQGTVEVKTGDNAWKIKVNLEVRPNPFEMKAHTGIYELEVVPFKKNLLIGNYRGKLNDRLLIGKVTGSIKPQWIETIDNHQPLKSLEHPRLVFRASQLEEVRTKAQTATGKAILARLQQSLNQKIYYQGYGLNGGSHAAGHCFLALLNQDQQSADQGWQIAQKAIKQSKGVNGKGNPRVLELSQLVTGIAIAYDLCYPLWDQAQRKSITRWLASRSVKLVQGGGANWNNNTVSNWNARTRSAAGIGALAIKQEPPDFFPQNQYFAQSDNLDLFLDTATRKVIRYLDLAIGDRGFGIEGDSYTSESAYLILPFLQAYANVMGKDLVTNSEAAWLLPHSMMRMVKQGSEVFTPAYGRHRQGADGSLFAYGLATVPEQFLPSILWTFDRYFGAEGDQSFGVNQIFPHSGIYSLVGYQENIESQNPATIFDRVMVDRQKGLFVFRNQWQDQQDILASIYLKKEPIPGGWSFPEVGSFRISGLGFNWATAGNGGGKPDQENVVYLPKAKAWQKSQPIAFISNQNGSGVVSLKTQAITNQSKTGQLQLIRSFGVDYGKFSGAEAVFAIVDLFKGDESATDFQEKVWIMHTEGKVTIEQNRFTIQAPSGETLQGIFASPAHVKISYEAATGRIMATGGNQFFVVMSLQRDNPPFLKLLNNFGLNSTVQVGMQKVRFIDNRIVFERF